MLLRGLSPSAIGFLCGALSAILYTVTNICLRQLGHVDAVWVSTIKALPTLMIVVPLMLLHRDGGMEAHPLRTSRWTIRFISWREVGWLVLTAFAVQIFGNVAFQWALSILGLTICVPIVLGTMLVGGAVTGSLILGENVTRRKWVAIAILIVATISLSYGAGAQGAGAQGALLALSSGTGTWVVGFALVANIASGVAYAFLGTMMRRSMRRGMSVAATLCVLSAVGTTLLVGWSLARLGVRGLMETDRGDLWVMACAGLFNALAFLAMAKSLQQVPVLYVQMLNASQAAISAAAGWLIFSEHMSVAVWIGLTLTALGLLVAGLREGPNPNRLLKEQPNSQMVADAGVPIAVVPEAGAAAAAKS